MSIEMTSKRKIANNLHHRRTPPYPLRSATWSMMCKCRTCVAHQMRSGNIGDCTLIWFAKIKLGLHAWSWRRVFRCKSVSFPYLLILSMSPTWSNRWLFLLAQVNTSLLVKVRQRGPKQCLHLKHRRPPPRCRRPPPWCVADLWAGMVDRFRSGKKGKKWSGGESGWLGTGKIEYIPEVEKLFLSE